MKSDHVCSYGLNARRAFVLAQMTNDVFEDVKVKKLRPTVAADGTPLVLIDFTYTLLTRAGFSVIRKGVRRTITPTQ